MKATAIILAGGKSRRLGRSKAFEPIYGRSLIGHTIERVKRRSDQILIVTSREQVDLFIGYEAEILVDVYPDKGPLGGIYTGLLASKFGRSIVVACDMPFLNDTLISYMVRLSTDCDLVIPRVNNMVEPLHAVYSKNCLPPIKYLIGQDKLSVLQLLAFVKVRYVETKEIKGFDPEYSSFFNINTDIDLARAREVEESREKRLSYSFLTDKDFGPSYSDGTSTCSKRSKRKERQETVSVLR